MAWAVSTMVALAGLPNAGIGWPLAGAVMVISGGWLGGAAALTLMTRAPLVAAALRSSVARAVRL